MMSGRATSTVDPFVTTLAQRQSVDLAFPWGVCEVAGNGANPHNMWLKLTCRMT